MPFDSPFVSGIPDLVLIVFASKDHCFKEDWGSVRPMRIIKAEKHRAHLYAGGYLFNSKNPALQVKIARPFFDRFRIDSVRFTYFDRIKFTIFREAIIMVSAAFLFA